MGRVREAILRKFRAIILKEWLVLDQGESDRTREETGVRRCNGADLKRLGIQRTPLNLHLNGPRNEFFSEVVHVRVGLRCIRLGRIRKKGYNPVLRKTSEYSGGWVLATFWTPRLLDPKFAKKF